MRNLINEEKSVSEILTKFPERNESSIKRKINHIKKSDKQSLLQDSINKSQNSSEKVILKL